MLVIQFCCAALLVLQRKCVNFWTVKFQVILFFFHRLESVASGFPWRHNLYIFPTSSVLVHFSKQYLLQNISSYRELKSASHSTNTCTQKNTTGTPKHPLDTKFKSIPPTRLAPVLVCVEGAGCCYRAWYNWKAEEEYCFFKNQPAGNGGMMGKQSWGPRSG